MNVPAVFLSASVCYQCHVTIQFVHLSSSPSFIFILNNTTRQCSYGAKGKEASGIDIPLLHPDRVAVFPQGTIVVMSLPSSGASTCNLVLFRLELLPF